jgi:hypothetical protein
MRGMVHVLSGVEQLAPETIYIFFIWVMNNLHKKGNLPK